MIKVGLIDDNYFLLNNYKEFLQDFPDISVVFTFLSLEELSKEKKQGITIKEPDEMAEQLFVSVYTANHHLKNIYQKLGVGSKSQLISRILQKTI